DRVPLSVWGASADDLWFAGGGLGSGPGALILRHDGSGFHEMATSETRTLWWVWGRSSSDVWLGGEMGAALHWDGTRLQSPTTNPTDTLYGVWGSADNDVWAVGGQPGGVSATVLHWDGSAWSKVDPGLTFTGAWFKVWGGAANCVYMVGESAAIARFDGAK